MSTALVTATTGQPDATRTERRADFDVWSTTATLIVTDPADLDIALAELNDELASIDATCSRFRADSEISRLLTHPGRQVTLSPILNEAVTQALRICVRHRLPGRSDGRGSGHHPGI